MKKMMMILAAVAVAGLAQAASVRWAVNNNAVVWKDGLNTVAAGEMYYLVDAASSAGIIAAINGGTFSGATAGVLGSALSTGTKGAVAANVITQASLIEGTTYNLAVLVFDTFGGSDYYQISSSVSQMAWTGASDIGASAGFTGGQFNAANWTEVVPEPTSMALLALGVAAIGLRRKFRA